MADTRDRTGPPGNRHASPCREASPLPTNAVYWPLVHRVGRPPTECSRGLGRVSWACSLKTQNLGAHAQPDKSRPLAMGLPSSGAAGVASRVLDGVQWPFWDFLTTFAQVASGARVSSPWGGAVAGGYLSTQGRILHPWQVGGTGVGAMHVPPGPGVRGWCPHPPLAKGRQGCPGGGLSRKAQGPASHGEATGGRWEELHWVG